MYIFRGPRSSTSAQTSGYFSELDELSSQQMMDKASETDQSYLNTGTSSESNHLGTNVQIKHIVQPYSVVSASNSSPTMKTAYLRPPKQHCARTNLNSAIHYNNNSPSHFELDSFNSIKPDAYVGMVPSTTKPVKNSRRKSGAKMINHSDVIGLDELGKNEFDVLQDGDDDDEDNGGMDDGEDDDCFLKSDFVDRNLVSSFPDSEELDQECLFGDPDQEEREEFIWPTNQLNSSSSNQLLHVPTSPQHQPMIMCRSRDSCRHIISQHKSMIPDYIVCRQQSVPILRLPSSASSIVSIGRPHQPS